MKTNSLIVSLVLATSLSAFGQNAPGDQPTADVELKDPVAVVNGEKISKQDLQDAFNEAVQSSGIPIDQLPAEQKKEGYRQILNDLIMEKLVSKAAEGQQVPDEEVQAEIEKIKAQFPSEDDFKKQLEAAGQDEAKLRTQIGKVMQQRQWVEAQIGDPKEVSDEEAQKFYNENKDQFEEPEQVKASHILFRVEPGDESAAAAQLEKAKEAAQRAKKGEDFNNLAKELSEEPGASERGGDLGYFSKDRMVPEFADAAFSMEKDQISEPVKTQFGWHIIKVEDKKPAGTASFEEVKDQLKAFLKVDQQRKAVGDLMDSLRQKAEISNSLEDGGSPQ